MTLKFTWNVHEINIVCPQSEYLTHKVGFFLASTIGSNSLSHTHSPDSKTNSIKVCCWCHSNHCRHLTSNEHCNWVPLLVVDILLCLSFDIRIMIGSLVSFNSSSFTYMRQSLYNKNTSKTKELQKQKPLISYLDIYIDDVLSLYNQNFAFTLPQKSLR